jgi:hypothetical protein
VQKATSTLNILPPNSTPLSSTCSVPNFSLMLVDTLVGITCSAGIYLEWHLPVYYAITHGMITTKTRQVPETLETNKDEKI